MPYIAVFDSGIGGLTVVKEIIERLPTESTVYFGDTARCPYGEKDRDTIIEYSLENAALLLNYPVKALVVACGTASSTALPALRQAVDIPVVGVIEPTLAEAAASSKNGRIAILATTATIRSGVYQSGIKQLLPEATLFPVACPLLVPMLERQCADLDTVRGIVKTSLKPLEGSGIDTAILGCTHYPLVADVISRELGPSVELINTSKLCAGAVARLLRQNLLLDTPSEPPEHLYIVSGSPDKFRQLSRHFFGEMIDEVLLREASLQPA